MGYLLVSQWTKSLAPKISQVIGHPPQPDGKVLLMKILVTFVTEHGGWAFVNLKTSLLE